MQKVKTTVTAGDTVNVLAGTYVPSQYQGEGGLPVWTHTQRLGSAGSPITIQANPGDTVIFDGGNTTYWMIFEASAAYGGHYVIVKDLRFQNYFGAAIGVSGNTGFSTHHVAILNNTFTAFTQGHSGAVQTGGTVNNSAQYVIMRDNTITNIGGSGDGAPSAQHCVYFAEGSTNMVFDHNVCDGISGYGLHGWGHGSGISSGNWIVRRNTMKNMREAGIITAGTNYNNIYIYNNTFFSLAIPFPAVDSTQTRSNIRLFNDGTLTAYRVLNNLGFGPLSSANFESASATPFTSSIMNNNGWVNTNNATRSYATAGSFRTLAQFQSATGFEANAITADPLFTNAGGGDFTLQATSPAINAGRSLTTAVGSGSSSTTLTVVDAGFFHNGFGLITGDSLVIGAAAAVTVTAVNYSTNVLTLSSARSWSNGDAVGFVFSGAQTDMGAYESGGTPGPVATVGTFYKSASGNDANDCTAAKNPATPKLTFASVFPCMAGGSTLYLRAGTHTDAVDTGIVPLQGGASFSAPTLIAAFPGETVTVAPTLTSTGTILLFSQAANHHIILDRLILDGVTTAGWAVKISGSAHHLRIQNSTLKRVVVSALLIDASNGNELLTSIVQTNQTNNLINIENGAQDTLIEGNDVSDYLGGAGISDRSHGSLSNSNTIIRANLVHHDRTGNTEVAIIAGFGTNALVANNVIHHAASGFRVAPSTVGARVFNNTIAFNTTLGITVDASATGTQIKNNLVVNNGSGIVDNSGTATLTTNLTTNPGFTNSTTGDFTLLPTSLTAINQGTALAEVPRDILGVTRGAPPEIGAYEFGGAVTAPGVPTNLQVASVVVGPVDVVTLTWNYTPANLLLGMYNVYRRLACTGVGVKLNVSLIRAATLTYTDGTVLPGNTYCWTVRAVNSNGVESTDSNEVTYVAAAYVPGTLGLSVGLTGGPTTYTAHLTWTFANGTPATVGFNVYRYDNCGVSGRTKLNGSLLSTATLVFDDTGVQNGKSHCWLVTGQSGTGAEVLFSGLVSIPVPNVPGVVGLHGAGAGQSTMMGGRR